MELTLLGTAAAEGWPAPFCACPNCKEARRRGGPNIRTRSGALVDDDLKIDFSPDTVAHLQRCGRSLEKLRTLVFTHQHADHIAREELQWVAPPFSRTPPKRPIAVYGNHQVLTIIRNQYPEASGMGGYFRLHELEALRAVRTAAGDEILPLPAEHIENAFVLRITRGRGKTRRTLFYGHDSGDYPKETLAVLARGPKVDVALFDCTNGGLTTRYLGHMGVEGVVRMAEAMRRRGVLADGAQLIATHFSHNGGLLHEALVRAFLPHGIAVAFDGMVVRT